MDNLSRGLIFFCYQPQKRTRGQSYKANFDVNYIKKGFNKLNFTMNYISFDVNYAKNIL